MDALNAPTEAFSPIQSSFLQAKKRWTPACPEWLRRSVLPPTLRTDCEAPSLRAGVRWSQAVRASSPSTDLFAQERERALSPRLEPALFVRSHSGPPPIPLDSA